MTQLEGIGEVTRRERGVDDSGPDRREVVAEVLRQDGGRGTDKCELGFRLEMILETSSSVTGLNECQLALCFSGFIFGSCLV